MTSSPGDSSALGQVLQWVFAEPPLRERLLAITDRQEFVGQVIQIAAERGLPLTAAEVESAMRANQRAWLERLIR